jgi:hypothetical protein
MFGIMRLLYAVFVRALVPVAATVLDKQSRCSGSVRGGELGPFCLRLRYSSGTTGAPLVSRTHVRVLHSNAKQIRCLRTRHRKSLALHIYMALRIVGSFLRFRWCRRRRVCNAHSREEEVEALLVQRTQLLPPLHNPLLPRNSACQSDTHTQAWGISP